MKNRSRALLLVFCNERGRSGAKNAHAFAPAFPPRTFIDKLFLFMV